jgi:hypothetical protein
MRLSGRRGLVLLVVLLLAPAFGRAQSRGLGRISGSVTDEGGTPLSGVAVRATMDGTNGRLEATSDDKGAWAVSGLTKGEWKVTFQIAGYVPNAAKVILPAELSRVPPISMVLKKVKS